jgi:hypothetical protein
MEEFDLSSYLTTKDILEDAEYWQSRLGRRSVTRNAVTALLRTGKLPGLKLGCQYFVKKEDWEEFKQIKRNNPHWRKKLKKKKEGEQRLKAALEASLKKEN